MKKTKFISIVIIVCLFAASCSGSNNENSKTPTSGKNLQGKVEFEKCGEFECAKISVPMYYKKPKGRMIDIAITKKSASNKKKRIGVLLVNPGGPGGSGIEFVKKNSSFLFSEELQDSFDIIGWDPRGVGKSTKPNCSRSLDKLFEDQDYSPDSEAELAALKEANSWIGKRCNKADSKLLPNLSTEDSVRDMESIRKALGEEKINYLGFSYGTALGQLYATLFPNGFRTMVIDGVLDLGLDPEKTAIEQIIGFEDSLNEFFNYCRTNTCSFAKGSDPKTEFIKIVESVDERPVVSELDSDVVVGPAQMDIGVPYYLYGGVPGWRSLDRALSELGLGDPTAIFDGYSQYLGRNSNGIYDGSYESFLTIGCADGTIGDEKKLEELAKSIQEKAPILGEASVFLSLPCATWPNVKQARVLKVKNASRVPIVVIGTTGDPATPVQWARSAAKSLENSVYIERIGEGHTAYGQGNACIDLLVDQYFLSGIAPKPQTCK